jgi:hypothetical protein
MCHLIHSLACVLNLLSHLRLCYFFTHTPIPNVCTSNTFYFGADHHSDENDNDDDSDDGGAEL